MNDKTTEPTLGEGIQSQLGQLDARVREIDTLVSDPEVAAQPGRLAALMRERGRLMRIVEPYRRWLEARGAREEAEEILRAAEDEEMRALAETEAEAQGAMEASLAGEIQELLLERQSGTDATRIMVEIRAGTGGDEAALFARDLYEMYTRYAEGRGWKSESISASPTELGGFKEMIFALEGPDVYKRLRFESGGHRVQRVPETETQGRIHTSAATVAVMPEPESIDIDIKDEDLEVETMRSSGPGGQNVNKVASAVRMTHLPTGIVVSMQDEKSQHRNREKALRILTARVYDHYESRKRAQREAERRSKIGSGDRSQRIRTYNFPQNRVTDHRTGFTAHNLDQVMQGNLDELLDDLAAHDRQERLAALKVEGAE